MAKLTAHRQLIRDLKTAGMEPPEIAKLLAQAIKAEFPTWQLNGYGEWGLDRVCGECGQSAWRQTFTVNRQWVTRVTCRERHDAALVLRAEWKQQRAKP